jgi:hypothetical protein
VADAGEIETEATGIGAGALTVIADEAVFPSLAAVTDTLPDATPVTRPELETVATPVLLELQPITRPVRRLLLASLVTADNWAVDPTCKEALAGDTVTEATGTGAGALTLSAEELLLPSLDALIIALPVPVALTAPAPSTVATLRLELSQVTVRSESGVPVESLRVAVATAICPIRMAEGLTVTVSVAIGVGVGGVTAMVA